MRAKTEAFLEDLLLTIGLCCFLAVVVMALMGIIEQQQEVGVHATPASAKPAAVIVPWCPEDAVPVGYGDFDGITWDAYACIPRDDITPGGFAVGVEVQKEDPWALTH